MKRNLLLILLILSLGLFALAQSTTQPTSPSQSGTTTSQPAQQPAPSDPNQQPAPRDPNQPQPSATDKQGTSRNNTGAASSTTSDPNAGATAAPQGNTAAAQDDPARAAETQRAETDRGIPWGWIALGLLALLGIGALMSRGGPDRTTYVDRTDRVERVERIDRDRDDDIRRVG